MTTIHGVCDSRFEAVREALAESLDKEDVGASAAVYLDGEPVADLWGGYADVARTIAWERDLTRPDGRPRRPAPACAPGSPR